MKIKNSHIVAAACMLIAGLVYAGNQYNWGTSTGSSWITPDDSAVTPGQVLQIGASGGAMVGAAVAPLTIYSQTLAQLNALTANTTGQLVYCSNCLNAIAVATGTVRAGSWTTVASSTTHIN